MQKFGFWKQILCLKYIDVISYLKLNISLKINIIMKYTHRKMQKTKVLRSLIYHTVNVYMVHTHIETVRTDMPTKCNLYV